jgi:signal transduction histidine kinase
MGALGDQENLLRSQAGTGEAQIGNEYAGVKTQLGAEQATKEQGVQSELSTSETQGKTAMQEARDLFRQTQQQNIAQLSGLGISSSSVAEALAERLGVETARRIAGVSGSINEVRTNATKSWEELKTIFPKN